MGEEIRYSLSGSVGDERTATLMVAPQKRHRIRSLDILHPEGWLVKDFRIGVRPMVNDAASLLMRAKLSFEDIVCEVGNDVSITVQNLGGQLGLPKTARAFVATVVGEVCDLPEADCPPKPFLKVGDKVRVVNTYLPEVFRNRVGTLTEIGYGTCRVDLGELRGIPFYEEDVEFVARVEGVLPGVAALPEALRPIQPPTLEELARLALADVPPHMVERQWRPLVLGELDYAVTHPEPTCVLCNVRQPGGGVYCPTDLDTPKVKHEFLSGVEYLKRRLELVCTLEVPLPPRNAYEKSFK